MDNTVAVKQQDISRRQFLGYAWAVSAMILLGQVMGAIVRFFWPRLKAGAFGTRVTIGKVEDFPVGSVTTFPQSKLFLVRLESGFLAMYRKCTHLGCIVPPWDEAQQVFNCPCHGSLFNREGEVLAGPAPRPLDLFPIEIIDGEIVVDTNPRGVKQRQRFDESQVAKV